LQIKNHVISSTLIFKSRRNVPIPTQPPNFISQISNEFTVKLRQRRVMPFNIATTTMLFNSNNPNQWQIEGELSIKERIEMRFELTMASTHA
jgi:hypothetical protein